MVSASVRFDRDNTGTAHTNSALYVPIYWLGGSDDTHKVADNSQDFHGGGWDSLEGKNKVEGNDKGRIIRTG